MVSLCLHLSVFGIESSKNGLIDLLNNFHKAGYTQRVIILHDELHITYKHWNPYFTLFCLNIYSKKSDQ